MNENPIQWQTRWPDPDTGDYRVDIELGLVRDSTGAEHLDATKVCVSSATRAITTSVLRRINVWSLTRRAIAEQVAPIVEMMRRPTTPGLTVVTDVKDGQLVTRTVEADLIAPEREAHWDAERERLRIDEAAERRTGRPRRPMTPELLREVARVHTEARRSGNVQPRRAVAEHFKISESSASRWITAARDEKLLTPSGRQRKEDRRS